MKPYIHSFLQIFVWLWQLPQVIVGCLWCIIARPRYLYSHHHVHLFTCRFGGGDSYCGVCESYGVIDVDRIQVVRVFDEDGKEYPALVARLNEYALRV